MKKSNPQTDKSNRSKDPVKHYFSQIPEPARTTLQKVRKAVLSAAPKGTTESISYGIPTFKHNGSIVAIAAFTNHCSFFPMGYAVIEQFKRELARYDVSKGTIRFPIDRPLPATLVRKMVKARLALKAKKK